MKKGLFALAAGTLGFGMTEYVMMGILPNIANDLGISIPSAGHFISAYALGVGIGAPVMVILARKRPLKQILLGLIALYTLGNLARHSPRMKRQSLFCASFPACLTEPISAWAQSSRKGWFRPNASRAPWHS